MPLEAPVIRMQAGAAADDSSGRIGRLDNPVELPLITTAKIAVIALQYAIGFVVARKSLAGDGIAKAIITNDAVAGHGTAAG
jgi:hypothetical protein